MGLWRTGKCSWQMKYSSGPPTWTDSGIRVAGLAHGHVSSLAVRGITLNENYPKSAEILRRNAQYIPGGVVSVNRATQPEIVFVRARGAYLWDADGNRYIDYHAGFAPHFLGHNDPYVTEAVIRGLQADASLYGSGTTVYEGQLAELICHNVPAAESVQLLNTGSEATYQAIRLARAVTEKDHVIIMQGGYNGWHNDVCMANC